MSDEESIGLALDILATFIVKAQREDRRTASVFSHPELPVTVAILCQHPREGEIREFLGVSIDGEEFNSRVRVEPPATDN